MSNAHVEALGSRSTSIWPTVWKFSLILAVFKLAYGPLTRAAGLVGNVPGLGLIGFIVAVVLLVMALRGFRSRNDGYMTFGEGFTIAFVVSVVSTVVAAAGNAVYLSLSGREMLAAQRETALSQAQANPQVDAQAMEVIQSLFAVVFTPGGMFFLAAIGGTIVWLVASLILAAVLKKPPPITA